MKWFTSKTWEYEKYYFSKWHIWFAWYPVVIEVLHPGVHKKVWLQNVLRCGSRSSNYDGSYWVWEYKNHPTSKSKKEK